MNLGASSSSARPTVALVRTDVLAPILEQQKLFRVALLDAQGGVLLSSTSGAPANALEPSSDARLIVSQVQSGRERFIVGAANSAVAPVRLVVDVPQSVAALTEAPLLEQLFVVGLLLASAAILVGIWIAARLSRPLESLAVVASEVGAGKFNVPIDVYGRDEVGSLATAFRTMVARLADRDEKLRVAHSALVQSEKMAAIGQLSAGLAHEVKNPLAGILGFAQLSRRKLSDPEAVRRNLDVIERETRRCSEIIGNLMQFARKDRALKQEVEINHAVQQAIAIVDHQLSLKKVKIVKDLAEGLPRVLGNANQIEQALINLMINSQQAMVDGGTVTVRSAHGDGLVQVSVEDTGPGVAPELRQTIFEPFFTTKPVGQGTGLGLSVTYGLIKDHGGDIVVDDAPSGGARFVVNLPAMAEDTAVNENDSGSRAA
jgi:two-component system, NtrC family, sensor kinase